MKRTNRGFAVYTEFTDTYGSRVRVQQSSSACAPRVWVFCKKERKDEDGVLTDTGVDWSPHLSPAQARKVAKALLTFSDAAQPGAGARRQGRGT